MPAKKKPSAAQLAARAKFTAMVRAKSKAKKSATKKASMHKDTKSHNVNIRVVSGTKKKTRAVGKATGQPSLFDRINNDYQTGTSNKEYDKKRVALPPGMRKSYETGNEYTERRANRSDKRNSLLGIGDYFDVKTINDLDNLKKEYKKLALKYHPDRGGTTEQMQSINNEYDKLRAKILKGSNLSEDQKKNEIVIDEAIREIVNVLILIPGIEIEVIGKWIWVSGNTYPVKGELKSAGLIFIKKDGKPYWVYKGVESLSRGGTPMDIIKQKYGVHKFDIKPGKSIQGIGMVRVSINNRMKLKRNLKKLISAINKRPI